MAFVRLAFFPGGTQEHYDALTAALTAAVGEPPTPAGRLLFAAGPADGGWQVVQVWRSKAELDTFNEAVLFPALARLGGAGFPAPPQVRDVEAAELVLSDL